MLNTYLQQVQRLLNDPSERIFNLFDLIFWINSARSRIASETQCVRVLPPSTGSVTSLTVNNAGSGYSPQTTISVTGPDAIGVGFQGATATSQTDELIFQRLPFANLVFGAGELKDVLLSGLGSGYAAPPVVTVNDPTGLGSGASLTATLSPHLTTQPSVEVYKFTDVAALIADQGVKSIIGVQSVSISWGAFKPTLRWIPWSAMQAYLRSTNVAAQNFPNYWSQYAQGVTGSIYVWPVPILQAQMEWDCYCLPLDLASDSDVEALPYPWSDSVPYYAAFLAFQSVQDRDSATYMLAEAKRTMREGRSFTSPAMVPAFY